MDKTMRHYNYDTRTFIRYFVFTGLVLFMLGCGGGGGGGNPPATLTVSAGNSQTIVLSSTLSIDASVTENGQPVQASANYNWSQVSGIGTANFSSPNTEDTSVTFSQGGSYVLRLTVTSNGATSSDTLAVTVNIKAAGVSGLANRPSNSTECVAPDSPPGVTNIQLGTPYPNLPAFTAPLAMYMAPGDASAWYVVQQSGQVMRFANNAAVSSVSTFINIADRVVFSGEKGLLGMAFHPDFTNNGYVYLSYINETAGRVSRVSRFNLDGTGLALDPSSEQIILSVAQPFSNHNGGQITFGPDGFLYIGLGDGGSGGDPQGHGQNTNTLLGSLLRIDVGDGTSGSYTIPADNPFVGGGGQAEIYAYGLRNPWRWSFDSVTGQLWLGDVGQNSFEEIDIITKGANYGWNIMEGASCYNATSCNQTGLTLPVAIYGRSEGQSVTGGYVYHGSNVTFLNGRYIYGDFGSGKIWSLQQSGPGQYTSTELLDTSLSIASFAEDNLGELYVINIGGSISKIMPGSNTGGQIPALLSGWGCFQSGDPTSFSANVIPYDINSLLWSDNADKGRFMAIPNGANISIDSESRFDLPVGSVVGKHFWINNQLIETRLLLHHQQPDGWKGYTYEWNNTGTDATLLSGAKDIIVNNQTWHFPSSAECDSCHTSITGFTLGPEIAQLNRPYIYPGASSAANQLITLESINILANPLSEAEKSSTLYAIDDTAYSTALRARSYLHTNCANCHQPGGPGGGNLDLRMATSLANTGICNQAPAGTDMGLINPVILAPGAPDASVLVLRMEDLGQNRMPPLASSIVDSQAMSVIRNWISGISDCM